MAVQKVKMHVQIEGANEAVRAFSRYGKDANAELRDAAQRSADHLAPMMARAMTADGGPSALVATSVRTKRDRFPVIAAGGTRRVASSSRGKKAKKPAAGDLFFGAEFGGRGRRTTQQFRRWKGTTGYAFYPTLRAHSIELIDAYRDALEALARRWGR
jgi:hypothetical protein